VFLIEHGYPETTAWEYIEEKKQEPLTRIAGMPTARHILQTLGTNWGRHEIHPTVWLAEWECKARVWSRSGVVVVADDMRFPNEVEAVRRLGGVIWRIERPDSVIDEEVVAHASEGRLNEVKFDQTIVNDGTIGDLQLKADIAFAGKRGRPKKKKEVGDKIT
jgi:hypothetical protein